MRDIVQTERTAAVCPVYAPPPSVTYIVASGASWHTYCLPLSELPSLAKQGLQARDAVQMLLDH